MIDIFLQYLIVEKGLSENTLHAYRNNIEIFLAFCENFSLDCTKVSLQDCMKYCSFLGKKGASSATLAQHISTLKSFYMCLERKGYIEYNPLLFLSTPKRMKSLPTVLTMEEVQALLEAPKMGNKLGIRDKVILELLYATGMRVSELCSLECIAVDIERGFVRVFGKGSKERFIPVHEGCITLLAEYMMNVRPLFCPLSNTLFLNRSGAMLTRQAIFLLIKKYATLIGIKKEISPHTIRHSFASHLLANGADIRTIQSLLGHEDILATEIYLQLSLEHIFSAHRRYHPRSSI